MTYPANDKQFEDKVISHVETAQDGTFSIKCGDGWTMWCGKDLKAAPEVGQSARFYGQGIGSRVRGLFIDGKQVWYRTEADDREQSEIDLYGADAADWLKRWDEGRSVFTIEMGGMGPGYEQCIHIVCAEVLRWFIANKCNASLWEDKDVWKQVRDDLQTAMFKVKTLNDLGLSGAQYGAGVNIAAQIYMKGPRGVMNDPSVKDRHIQVQRTFPGMAVAS